MPNSLSQNKILSSVIRIAILVVVLIIVAWLLAWNGFKKFSQANQVRADVQAQLSRAEGELVNLKTALQALNNLSDVQQTFLAKALPVEPDTEVFMRTIHQLAQQNNVLVTALTPQQAQRPSPANSTPEETWEPGSLMTVNITLTLKGQTEEILNFVDVLERDVRLMDINTISVQIEKTSSAAGATITTANLTGSIYYLNGVAEAANAAFPYGYSFDTALFDLPEFQSLRITK